MNKTEFAQIAGAIRTAFPRANALPDAESMNLWFEMLKDLDYMLVQNAVLEHIATNTFVPSIAEIRKKCTDRTCPVDGWEAAWGKVLKAISNYGYYREDEALESLDGLTRDVVKKFGFRNLCTSDNMIADRAHFKAAYENMAGEKRLSSALPVAVNEMRQQLIAAAMPTLTKAIEGQEKTPDAVLALPEEIQQIRHRYKY